MSKSLHENHKRVLMRFILDTAKAHGIETVRKDGSFVPMTDIMKTLTGKPLGSVRMYRWAKKEMIGKAMIVKTPPKPPKLKKPKVVPIESGVFFVSAEWRKVRFASLKAAKGCCHLCGRSQRVHGVVLHVDHIKPRSKRPDLALTLSNLQVLCEDCNLGKGNRDSTDWRPDGHVYKPANDEQERIERFLDGVDWRKV